MKRTKRNGSFLQELQKVVPTLSKGKEEKLVGGFLGMSKVASEGENSNTNYKDGCKCINFICFGQPTAPSNPPESENTATQENSMLPTIAMF